MQINFIPETFVEIMKVFFLLGKEKFLVQWRNFKDNIIEEDFLLLYNKYYQIVSPFDQNTSKNLFLSLMSKTNKEEKKRKIIISQILKMKKEGK